MQSGMNKGIVGVGAALVDLLVEENDAFIKELGSEKGGMTLVDLPIIDKAIAQTKAKVKVVPGGSACNTMVGIGNLGGNAKMIGRVGQDDLSKAFIDGLSKAGVERRLQISPSATGRVLSVVTPDAQRTMFTYLGASSELSPDDITIADFSDAGMVLLEGYLLFNRPVVEKILSLAKQAKVKVILDLASFQVVEFCRDFIDQILASSIDMVLANEDEAKAYTGLGEADSLNFLAGKVETAVVKVGKNGVLVAKGAERFTVPAHMVKALDTTGAGDLWASGFLYGITEGMGLEKAASLGCKVGSEVVQVMGAVIPEEGWKRIHAYRAGLVG